MGDAGTTTFELPADHPGVSDPAYRARRAVLAELGARYRPDDPIPEVGYTAEEDALWRLVTAELAALHATSACQAYLDGALALDLPTDHVPQLRGVDRRLRDLSAFGLRPVPGLLETTGFFEALAAREFPASQYVRHASVPFYTPEPDVIHELVGHAAALADRRVADLYEAAGAAAGRTEGDAALDFIGRVFWFTLEFGVVHEDGELKAYGAGLLSSFGELQSFRAAEIRPWDLVAMGTQEYDLSTYQPVLFAAPSMAHAVDSLGGLFESWDDDVHGRLTHPGR